MVAVGIGCRGASQAQAWLEVLQVSAVNRHSYLLQQEHYSQDRDPCTPVVGLFYRGCKMLLQNVCFCNGFCGVQNELLKFNILYSHFATPVKCNYKIQHFIIAFYRGCNMQIQNVKF